MCHQLIVLRQFIVHIIILFIYLYFIIYLQSAAAGSAMWATNVGNEQGEVLMSVLTQSPRPAKDG